MDNFTRPQATPTSVDDHAPSAVGAIHTEDHVVWDEPDRHWAERLEPMFVLGTWLLGILATLAILAVSTTVVALIVDRPLTGATNTDLGVLSILSAMSTFIGFVVVMTIRLVHVAHDRVVNSLAVAALHIGFAIVLLLGEVVGRNLTGQGASSFLTGDVNDQVGTAFTVIERSAVAAVLACLLAIGMVPARGERPSGTQTEFTEQDHQL